MKFKAVLRTFNNEFNSILNDEVNLVYLLLQFGLIGQILFNFPNCLGNICAVEFHAVIEIACIATWKQWPVLEIVLGTIAVLIGVVNKGYKSALCAWRMIGRMKKGSHKFAFFVRLEASAKNVSVMIQYNSFILMSEYHVRL